MALELDPIYYTETMVRILREQGSSLYAMELAEKILAQNPDNESVGQLLKEMKEEARASFERFRQAGRVEDLAPEVASPAPAEEAPPETPVVAREDLAAPPALPDNVVALRELAPKSDPAPVKVLRQLLQRVQGYRNNHGN